MLEKIGIVLICCCLPMLVIGAMIMVITWMLGSSLMVIVQYIIAVSVVIGLIGIMFLCIDLGIDLLGKEGDTMSIRALKRSIKKAIMKRKGYRHINKNISKMWRKEQ